VDVLLKDDAFKDVLLANDQLSIERKKGTVFPGFLEGPLQFNPTYKFHKVSLATVFLINFTIGASISVFPPPVCCFSNMPNCRLNTVNKTLIGFLVVCANNISIIRCPGSHLPEFATADL